MSIPLTVCFRKLLTNDFRSSFEIPEFATNLAISLRSCQSNGELGNEVVKFDVKFTTPFQSSRFD